MRAIAIELAKVDKERAVKVFDRALQLAEGIEERGWGARDAIGKAYTLRKIAAELAKVDEKRALASLRSISERESGWTGWKAKALAKVAALMWERSQEATGQATGKTQP